MLLARKNGLIVSANPGDVADCPSCGKGVIAKCGELKVWHWAHAADSDCDTWAEHETVWHAGWKDCFPPERVEVVRGVHRADAVTDSGVVVELQHSSISPVEISAREAFYGSRMIWIVDGEPFIKNVVFHQRERHFTFYWRWARQSWWKCSRSLYWDIRDGWLFHVRKIHPDTPCHGWGQFIHRKAFIQSLRADAGMVHPDVQIGRCSACRRNAAIGLERPTWCRFCYTQAPHPSPYR